MPGAFAIALMVDTGNTYGRNIAEGVVEYVNEIRDGRLVIQLPFEMKDLAPLHSWPFTGLIIQAQRDYQLELANRLTLPSVNVSVSQGLSNLRLPTVCSDNAAIGRLAAKYFIERGFQNFAFLGERERYYSQIRGGGFVSGVREAGFVCDTFHWQEAGEKTIEPTKLRGRRGVAGEPLPAWLLSLPKPVAIFASNDLRAAQGFRACESVQIAVPEMVCILGVDDESYVNQIIPISSIPQPGVRVGYEAVRLLDRITGGEAPPTSPVLIEPTGHVSTRKSTDTLPINDPDVARAIRYIREHADRPIGVEDLLEHISLTRRTFERRFRAMTGHSPLEEIHRAHIERAKDLLAKTDRPVPEIVAGAGFGNNNRFGITFKAHVGMTPTAYRRQFRPA